MLVAQSYFSSIIHPTRRTRTSLVLVLLMLVDHMNDCTSEWACFVRTPTTRQRRDGLRDLRIGAKEKEFRALASPLAHQCYIAVHVRRLLESNDGEGRSALYLSSPFPLPTGRSLLATLLYGRLMSWLVSVQKKRHLEDRPRQTQWWVTAMGEAS